MLDYYFIEEFSQVVRETLSGMSLQAIPVPSLGTQLDADTLTVAVALRIVAPVCELRACRCGANAFTPACRFSAGRLTRHFKLNNEIKKALQATNVPCLLRPFGLSRDDG